MIRGHQEAVALQSDVLVIGGGIAGCLAAIRARESGLDVVLVEKANVGRSGVSHQMNGVLTCFVPGKDNPSEWYTECVQAGDGLVDLKRLEGMIEETAERIRELETWGVKFQREGGELIRKPGFGQHHARNAVMSCGGFQLMSVVRGEVVRGGVRIVERVMVTDLLTSDGTYPAHGVVTGAAGFNIRSGEFYVFKAKAVVLAAGTGRHLLSTTPTTSLTDDGRAMAFRAGCEIRNMEFSMIGPTARHFGVLGANILLGEGAILVNAAGDRFMAKWDPVRQERAPRSVMGRAIATEERAGRAPVYLDATQLEESAHRRIEKAIPEVVSVLAKGGLELRKDRVEWTTELAGLGPGGIKVDKDGATNLSGLYAAGACTDHGEDGVINVITHGMESAIGGDRAGRAVKTYLAQAGEPKIASEQIQEIRGHIFAPLHNKDGMNYRQACQLCGVFKQEGLVGPVRNARGLNRAIDLAKQIGEESLPGTAAGDYHELSKVLGLRNELVFIELLARTALHRKESRGSHFREDFPEKDDANWLKWVIARRSGNEINIHEEAIN